jgi:hypothetical protein
VNNHSSNSLGLDALNFEPKTKGETWVTKSDCTPDLPLMPSSKTTALKAILLKGFDDAPLDKVSVLFLVPVSRFQYFSP